jgi:hypothetical protein
MARSPAARSRRPEAIGFRWRGASDKGRAAHAMGEGSAGSQPAATAPGGAVNSRKYAESSRVGSAWLLGDRRRVRVAAGSRARSGLLAPRDATSATEAAQTARSCSRQWRRRRPQYLDAPSRLLDPQSGRLQIAICFPPAQL